MDYTQIIVNCAAEQREILLAFLSELPFDTFEETDTGLSAYLPTKDFGEEEKQQLQAWAKQFDFTWEPIAIPAQNWNKTWESGFQPIRVGDFCSIRADFHDPVSEVAHDLIINPKMAFGTGHHETTFSVIETMEGMDFTDKSVLDYGCGTGVLAILAARCGASRIDAIDNDILSYENTLENLEANQTTLINTYHGTLDQLPPSNYDIILANINRNVILESLGALYSRINTGGFLVISGFLLEDQEKMGKAAEKAGFKVESVRQQNDWLCMGLSPTSA